MLEGWTDHAVLADAPATAIDEATHRAWPIAALVQNFSVELTPREALDAAAIAASLTPGTRVYVTYVPGGDHRAVIAACRRIAEAGMIPVPHVPARAMTSWSHLRAYLDAVTGEAGVEHVLIVGGGAAEPAGPFARSMELIETGLLERFQIKRIDFAGHPEGNGAIAADDLVAALADKHAYAAETDVDVRLVTQFCFDARPIIAFDKALRAAGIALPVHVGLAGCATLKTLIHYAVLCGVGSSLRALSRQGRRIARLGKVSTPDGLVRDLALYRAQEPASTIRGLHFFPFGSLERTARWANGAAAGAVEPTADGFRVDGFDPS